MVKIPPGFERGLNPEIESAQTERQTDKHNCSYKVRGQAGEKCLCVSAALQVEILHGF